MHNSPANDIQGCVHDIASMPENISRLVLCLRKWGLPIIACMILPVSTGCSSPGVVFPPVTPELTWPTHGPKARLKYMGELRQDTDLKPASPWYKSVGDFIFGATPPSELQGPHKVIVIGDVVWVTDLGDNCLHGFDLKDRHHYRISSFEQKEREGQPLKLHAPNGLCPGPDSTFFCCDSASGIIFQLSGKDGSLLRVIRPKWDIERPTALAFSSTANCLFVLDTTSHNIKKIGLDGQLQAIIGKRGSAPGEFNFPADIKCDGTLLWVSDSCNGRIQALDYDGKSVRIVGRFGKSAGEFSLPKGLAIDSAKRIYVVDSRFENVQIFNNEGQLLMDFGQEGNGRGEFSLPSGLFIDTQDRVWVCDSYNHRLQVLEPIKEGSTDEN